MEELPHDAILYANSSHGVYIPQYFAESIDLDAVTLDGMAPEAITECMDIIRQGPYADGYWEAWDDILIHLIVTANETGTSYHLWQDGDLWLIPTDAEEV